ncbi:MAG: helix-turn-helix domain-containing protein [Acidimicrobiales bacterium]
MSTVDELNQGLIDIGDVATLLGRSERFVRRLVEENRISFIKVGKYVMFRRSDVEDWIDARTVPQKHFD